MERSWSGTASSSSGSAGGLKEEERKRKRMLSNRDSARRSRQRKQKHLDELATQAAHLRGENARLLAALASATHGCLAAGSENSVLRTQAAELAARLRSLGDILLLCINLNLGLDIDIDIVTDIGEEPPCRDQQPLAADMLHYC